MASVARIQQQVEAGLTVERIHSWMASKALTRVLILCRRQLGPLVVWLEDSGDFHCCWRNE